MRTGKEQTRNTRRELAEAHIYPTGNKLANAGQEQAFWEERKRRANDRTAEEQLLSDILRLKFRIEDHLNSDSYDDSVHFGHFLRNYIELLGKKDKEFAAEIDIKPTELSQLINDHRDPNNELLVRLEIHSNNNIPAITWYRLLEKRKEHYLMSDKGIRKEASKHVKRKLSLSL